MKPLIFSKETSEHLTKAGLVLLVIVLIFLSACTAQIESRNTEAGKLEVAIKANVSYECDKPEVKSRSFVSKADIVQKSHSYYNANISRNVTYYWNETVLTYSIVNETFCNPKKADRIKVEKEGRVQYDKIKLKDQRYDITKDNTLITASIARGASEDTPFKQCGNPCIGIPCAEKDLETQAIIRECKDKDWTVQI